MIRRSSAVSNFVCSNFHGPDQSSWIYSDCSRSSEDGACSICVQGRSDSSYCIDIQKGKHLEKKEEEDQAVKVVRKERKENAKRGRQTKTKGRVTSIRAEAKARLKGRVRQRKGQAEAWKGKPRRQQRARRQGRWAQRQSEQGADKGRHHDDNDGNGNGNRPPSLLMKKEGRRQQVLRWYINCHCLTQHFVLGPTQIH